ncbi:MAG TPA: TRAP transporter small permease subunit, partial [Rectinema sp.]|nr:TRAP transporter small permease subunit [Rectinema sp.]
MRKDLWRIVNRFERILTGFIAVLMVIVTIVVCWQVFDRYVLHKSPYWAEEFSVTAMMWMGLLGAASAVWTGDHMRLELLTKHLPARFGLVLEILIEGAIIY